MKKSNLLYVFVVCFLRLVPNTVSAQNFQGTYVAGDFGLTQGIAASTNRIVMQSGINANNHDILLTAVDDHGNILWSHSYGDVSADDARSLIATNDGGFVISGISTTPGIPDQAGLVFKIDSTGLVQWRLAFGDAVKLEAIAAAEMHDHGLMVLSRENQSGFYLLRLDEAGNLLWMNKYVQPGNMQPEFLLGLTNSDHVMVGGECINAGISVPFACRIDESGNVLWAKQISWQGQRSVAVTAANIDAQDHLYLGFDDGLFKFMILDDSGNVLHSSINGFADSQCNIHNYVHSILPIPNNLVLIRADFRCGVNQDAYLAYFDNTGDEVWGLSDPVSGSGFAAPPNIATAQLTRQNDFLFFNNMAAAGQPMTLVKSNLTLSKSCSRPADAPFIHSDIPVTASSFPVDALPFTGVYPKAMRMDNYAAAANVGCINTCRVASFFKRPELTEPYVCKNTTLEFKNYSFNATSYQWYYNATPVSSMQDLNYTFATTGDQRISLVASNGSCSDSTVFNVRVEDATTLAAISANGPVTFCSGNSVVLQSNYENTSFQWELNGVPISGATAYSYTATTGGNYRCHVLNDCGSAYSNTIVVTVNAGTAPTATISANGPTAFCTGGSVTLSANTGAGFSWQWKNNNAIINGANTSTYVAAVAGTYTCVVSNSCGSATSNSLTVSVSSLPPQPGSIAGPASVCHHQNNVNYSIAALAGVSSYTWTVPSGAKINSGQGTTAIQVRFGNSGGNISVKANNACGSGAGRNLSVVMPCREAAASQPVPLNVTIFPNPSSGAAVLMVESDEDLPCFLRVTDMTGRLVEEVDNIAPGETTYFGTTLSTGIYLAEIRQGDERKILRIVRSR